MLHRKPNGDLDFAEANRYEQQLFLANMFHRNTTGTPSDAPQHRAGLPDDALVWPAWQQLALLPAMPRILTGRDLQHRADPQQAAELDEHAAVIAARLGWADRLRREVCIGLRIVIGLRDHRDDPVRASDVTLLSTIRLPVDAVTRVLADAGMLADDRVRALDAWAAAQISRLPDTMAAELTLWFEVMKHGSLTPPRRRPRSETTIQLHLRWALPTLLRWAAAGHYSLREITRDDVVRALPPSGNPRAQVGQGLKSIFRLLKARKMVFTDPTTRIATGRHETRQPLPVDLPALRQALTSNNPAHAAVAALIAFHGLRTSQVQLLRLIDVRDRVLHVDDRAIPLAEPVQQALAAWLDYRRSRWPRTNNAYLFVTTRTANTDAPVSRTWVWQATGPRLSATDIRQDRILDEAQATNGDVRRLADLFGLSIAAGNRYAATVEHPDLTALT
ncbi:hypothetical protein [Micromonospora sp. LOL_024]|uniref:hypothetical protein n=1 Tax=Micromonospora sp. LOL_024 TaxID=3345412 RepID=UPI003A8877A4